MWHSEFTTSVVQKSMFTAAGCTLHFNPDWVTAILRVVVTAIFEPVSSAGKLTEAKQDSFLATTKARIKHGSAPGHYKPL